MDQRTERGCMDLKVNLKEIKKHKVSNVALHQNKTSKSNVNIYLKYALLEAPIPKYTFVL